MESPGDLNDLVSFSHRTTPPSVYVLAQVFVYTLDYEVSGDSIWGLPGHLEDSRHVWGLLARLGD